MGAQIFKTPTSNSHHALTFLLPAVLLLITITNMQTTVATSSSSQTYKTYVKTACNSTTYPLICYKSLSSYASKIKSNPRKLCIYALSVTLTASKNASSVVSKQSKKAGLTPTEKGVINDCLENIKESIDELKDSLTSMKNLGVTGGDVQDDIKTWVSAVLTDDATCTDEFDDMKVSTAIKTAIKNSIVTAARLASNALSLIDKLS
ncbi:pectinesterase inhibitor 4-like [Pyrus x bretschneideri]|uniref:pectinesterase inhibitor 4-like n=1 Tax=Pyrus x bretschneideri TaxID=225117 RepID=UPI000510DBE3|nr:pectinesterase inhibitor 4-like [Pyrus x bretschneideri]